MNQAKTIEHEAVNRADWDQASILDLLLVLARHKKLVIGLPLAAAFVAAAISLTMPDIFKASTKLLPPQQPQSGAAALLSQLGGIAGAAAGVSGLKNPNDLYMGMLKSRTVADRLIAKYDLKKAYETDSQEKAQKRLADRTIISSAKDGLISIEVEDEDRKRAAQLANSYVDELTAMTTELAVTEAGQRRVFFERQLSIAKDNLAVAEAKLKGGIESGGVVSVDADSRAVVETVARLRAQASAKEVELNAMKGSVTSSHPDYMRVQHELSSLRGELARLENGRSLVRETDEQSKSSTGLENIKVLRDVKYYQMLYELLAKQYELARLDEAKEVSIIQVLDAATEPELKAKPKRALIVIFSFVLGLIVAVVWVFALEARRKAMSTARGAANWAELKAHLGIK